jgi:hypothetical protein
MNVNDEKRNGQVSRLCECIRKTGASLRFCAQITNMNVNTVYSWKKNHPDINEEIALAYQDFDDSAEAICTSSILQSAKGDWRAAISWLERTKPHKYGKSRARQAPVSEGENTLRIEEEVIYPQNDLDDEYSETDE